MNLARILPALVAKAVPHLNLSDKMKNLLTILLLLVSSAWSMQRAGEGTNRANGSNKELLTATSDPATPQVVNLSTLSDSQRVLRVAAGKVGVREATGRNDGPEVEAMLRSTGNAKGDPWCASFVYAVAKEALGVRNPYSRSAYSPDMVAGGRKDARTARPADTFGIYMADKGRVAHTGLVERMEGGFAVTIEGNTSNSAALGSAQDREATNGGGVYRKRRPLATLYRVKTWVAN